MTVTGDREFPDHATAITHLVVVADMERSRDWYRDVLGANVYRECGGSSCVLQLLDTWLLLVTGGGPTEDKPTVTFAPVRDPDRAATETIFRVPDCLAAYEELRSRGAEFLTPPVTYEHEIRAFFRDPDGNLFEISELRT